MAWVCSSCGVRNATNSAVCRWCGRLAAQPQQPESQQPVPYQPQPVYCAPPPQPPVYYPQQQTGPMAGYPLRPSVVNDLRAMGGREAAKLTFGASVGAGFGWRVGQTLGGFAGCLLVLVGVAVLLGVIGIFAAHSGGHSPASARTRLDPVFLEHNDIPVSPDNPYRFEGNYSGWSLKKAERAHREFIRDQRQWEIDHPMQHSPELDLGQQ